MNKPETSNAPTRRQDEQLLILRDDRIIETVATLEQRISERFPESGLSRVCGQLHDLARQASDRSAWISRPILSIRIAGYMIAFTLVAIIVGIITQAVRPSVTEEMTVIVLIQIVESGLNDIIFLVIAIYFLISFETRIKRRRALAAVHELRSIAHVIDMHQLTKDPERVLNSWQRTEHSPKESMTPFQLNRYLDYCSEMLALTGKIASLYVQRFDDAASVAAVSELEQLTTGLSRKIWQKIIAARTGPTDFPFKQEPPTDKS